MLSDDHHAAATGRTAIDAVDGEKVGDRVGLIVVDQIRKLRIQGVDFQPQQKQFAKVHAGHSKLIVVTVFESVPIFSIETEIGPPSMRRSTFCTALPFFPLTRFSAVPIETMSPGNIVM